MSPNKGGLIAKQSLTDNIKGSGFKNLIAKLFCTGNISLRGTSAKFPLAVFASE